MSLFKRLFTFGIGFFIGIMLLIFFWDKKDASFNYGPDARVISQILKREKQVVEPNVEKFLQNRSIDSTGLRKIIKNADINFSKSNQHKEPCREYFIESQHKQDLLELQAQLCDSVVTFYRINKKS